MEPSRGNIFLCWDHVEAIGLVDLFMATSGSLYGKCSVCGKENVAVMQIEKGRYDAMLIADPKNELTDEPFASGVGRESHRKAGYREKRRRDKKGGNYTKKGKLG